MFMGLIGQITKISPTVISRPSLNFQKRVVTALYFYVAQEDFEWPRH